MTLTPNGGEDHLIESRQHLLPKHDAETPTGSWASMKHMLQTATISNVPNVPRKRRILPLLLASLYSILLLFQWIVTVVMSYRPINYPSWNPNWTPATVQSNREPQRTTIPNGLKLQTHYKYYISARYIESLLAVSALPLTSAICARAAIVYIQNMPDGTFKLSQIVALADRNWNSFFPLRRFTSVRHICRRPWKLGGSKFLMLSIALSSLGAIVWPLQQGLVSGKTIPVGFTDDTADPVLDADITGLSQVKSREIIVATRASIISAAKKGLRTNIWQTASNNKCTTTIALQQSPSKRTENFFVSLVPPTTSTGICEGHGFRFNSSLHSEEVDAAEYPQLCPGFSTTWADPHQTFDFRICATGDTKQFPWDVRSRNRQDLEEALYLQLHEEASVPVEHKNRSFTQRCIAKTSIGYFRLPNHKERGYGELITEFNLSATNDPKMLLDDADGVELYLHDPKSNPVVTDAPALGPLLTATLALFGPSSFFDSRANAANTGANGTFSEKFDDCADLVPFFYIDRGHQSKLERLKRCATNEPSMILPDLKHWLQYLFSRKNTTEAVFDDALLHASEATLMQAMRVPRYFRVLYKSPGHGVYRLEIRPAFVYMISVMIMLQITGLMALGVYSARFPTWTDTADASSMFQLGAQLDSGWSINTDSPITADDPKPEA